MGISIAFQNGVPFDICILYSGCITICIKLDQPPLSDGPSQTNCPGAASAVMPNATNESKHIIQIILRVFRYFTNNNSSPFGLMLHYIAIRAVRAIKTYQSEPPLRRGGVCAGLSAGGSGRVTAGCLGVVSGCVVAGGFGVSGAVVVPGVGPGVIAVLPPDWPAGAVVAGSAAGLSAVVFGSVCCGGCVWVGGFAFEASLSPAPPAKKYHPAAATTKKTAATTNQRLAELCPPDGAFCGGGAP